MAIRNRGNYAIYLSFALIILFINGAQSEEYLRSKRRMYAMCPPSFERIGSDCYYVSKRAASWLDGHFNCKDKNSKLAEPEKVADRKLRQFLLKHDNPSQGEIWIGGSFDRINKVWQWGYTGVNITHNSFSKLDPWSSQTLDFQCIVLNPKLKYRWSARSCVQSHRYVCQHKMPRVSEKNRFKVYNRWNQTYPNQFANEVALEVISNPSTGSRQTSFVRPVGSNETIPVRTRRKHYSSAALPIAFELMTSTAKPPIDTYITNEINPIKNRSFGDLIVIEKSKEQIMRERGNRRQRTRVTQSDRNKIIENNETTNDNQQPKRTSFDISVARKRTIERRQRIRQQRKLKREQLKQEKLAAQRRFIENEATKKRLQVAKAEIERQRELQKQEEANRLNQIENEKLIEKQHKEKLRQQEEEHNQRIKEIERLNIENENQQNNNNILDRFEQERIEKLEQERQRREKEETERVEKEQALRKQKEKARLEAKLAQEAQLKKLAEEEQQQLEEQKRLEEAERRQQEEEMELKNREKLLKEEELRLQREREEDKRRIKALRQEKHEIELKKKADEKRRRLHNRLSKLSESDRLVFLERLRQKHKNSDGYANEAK